MKERNFIRKKIEKNSEKTNLTQHIAWTEQSSGETLELRPHRPHHYKEISRNMRLLLHSRDQRACRTGIEGVPLQNQITATTAKNILRSKLEISERNQQNTSIHSSGNEIRVLPKRESKLILNSTTSPHACASSIRRSFVNESQARRKMLLSETFALPEKSFIESSVHSLCRRRTLSKGIPQKYTTREKVTIYSETPTFSSMPPSRSPGRSQGNQRITELEQLVELLKRKIQQLEKQNNEASKEWQNLYEKKNEQWISLSDELEEMYANYSSVAKDCIEMHQKYKLLRIEFAKLCQENEKFLLNAELENSHLRMKIRLMEEILEKRQNEVRKIEKLEAPSQQQKQDSSFIVRSGSCERISSSGHCLEDSVNFSKPHDFLSKCEVEMIFPKQLKSYYASSELQRENF